MKMCLHFAEAQTVTQLYILEALLMTPKLSFEINVSGEYLLQHGKAFWMSH